MLSIPFLLIALIRGSWAEIHLWKPLNLSPPSIPNTFQSTSNGKTNHPILFPIRAATFEPLWVLYQNLYIFYLNGYFYFTHSYQLTRTEMAHDFSNKNGSENQRKRKQKCHVINIDAIHRYKPRLHTNINKIPSSSKLKWKIWKPDVFVH